MDPRAPISLIEPNLFIGDMFGASDPDLLDSYRIDEIVCCAGELAFKHPKPVTRVDMMDTVHQDDSAVKTQFLSAVETY